MNRRKTLLLLFFIPVMIYQLTIVANCSGNNRVDKILNNGISLFEQQKYEEATQQLDNALVLDPNNLTIMFWKGRCALELEDLNSAEGWFIKILEEDSLNIKTIYWLGKVLEQRGEIEEAKGQFEKIANKNLKAKSDLDSLEKKFPTEVKEKEEEEKKDEQQEKEPGKKNKLLTGKKVPWWLYTLAIIFALLSIGVFIVGIADRDEEAKTGGCGCFIIVWIVFYFVSGFYIYGLKGAMIVTFIFNLALILTAQLGWIPVLGPFLYLWAAKKIVLPKLFAWFPYIEPNWLINFAFITFFISSVMITIKTLTKKY